MSDKLHQRYLLKNTPAVKAKRDAKAKTFRDIRGVGYRNTARALFRSVLNVRDF